MDSKIICFQLTEKEKKYLLFKNQIAFHPSDICMYYLVPGGETTFKESSAQDKLI